MAKTVVEDCLQLNINNLSRDSKGVSCLVPIRWTTFSWTDGNSRISTECLNDPDSPDQLILELDYNKGDDSINIPVIIEFTRMPNGGRRPWFRCPLIINRIACNRRVGRLYLPWYGRYFGCRHCYDLAYRSQQEWLSKEFRQLLRYLRIFNR